MSKLTFVTLILFTFMLSNFLLAQEVAQESLVGYWPFDEGSGKEAKDASGNGNHGEFVESPKWVSGKFEKALEFDGSSSYVVVSDDDSLDLADALTIMAWFSPTDISIAGTRMMSKNNSYFVMFDFGTADAIELLVKPGNDFVESKTKGWNEGEWYHFAGTYDGDTLRVYINGKLEGETEGVPNIATSNLDLWIGADDLPNYFPGIIDEVRIYRKALTEDEINQAMQGPYAVQPENRLAVTWGMIKKK